jgi:hypothetical protein
MKNFKIITLSLAFLGVANIPAIPGFKIPSFSWIFIGPKMISNLIPANTKANHAKLHASLLLVNLVVPAIVNTAAHLKANGLTDTKTSFSTGFKHVSDFCQLFKKEVIAESETPKTFRQKWAEFAQTHKTSASLIKTQLAALTLSGLCGAYTQRKYGYIAYCYATLNVHRKDVKSGKLPNLNETFPPSFLPKILYYFPDGFENQSYQRTYGPAILFKPKPSYMFSMFLDLSKKT